MYDTARRVALVKQRVRENTRRRQKAERLIASRRCLRRVFSRTRFLTSATRLAVSYISFEPPLWLF